MMSQPVVQFSSVSKGYGQHQVLDKLGFSVLEGEIFALVGVNGAGKTTLMKSLLDFCDIEQGEITLYGKPHTDLQSRMPVAFLSERFMPPDYMTGQDFLSLMMALYRLPYDSAIVADWCCRFGLDETVLSKSSAKLSKGMAQKLGLIACFMSGKSLTLMDEPMSGLDPQARSVVKTVFRDISSSGRTLFFSTHMLADVEVLCHRMAILHEGNIRFIGSPTACCEQFSATTLEEAYLKCIGLYNN
jgi:ABC-2 type transport system ATP-binding protein